MSQIDELIFATGNKNKTREASQILGFTVANPKQEFEIAEIQLESTHWKEIEKGNYLPACNYVARAKAINAERSYNQSVLVEDIALFIPALQGRPGTDIKAWCEDELMQVLSLIHI